MGITIREEIEQLEAQQLCPQAVCSSQSKGRAEPEVQDDYRTDFQRDRDRILHTKAFRRLKRKTQVFLSPEGDHYRTRLTHTLEVMQISRTVSRALRLNEDLTEAIALGHDLGHTPFGHAGEAALNEVYAPGFFHFEQSLRVVDKLEHRGEQQGLNLTHEVRDGILYHSKGKAVLKGLASEGPNTREGGVVSICDAIAYINHDIDDAIRAGVITLNDLPQDAIAALGMRTSDRIDTMVVGLIEGSRHGDFGILPEVLVAMNTLRDHLYTVVYPQEAIESEIRKAKHILKELYGYFMEKPSMISEDVSGEDDLERRVVDFLAGMTDEYALRIYQKLMMPTPWKP